MDSSALREAGLWEVGSKVFCVLVESPTNGKLSQNSSSHEPLAVSCATEHV